MPANYQPRQEAIAYGQKEASNLSDNPSNRFQVLRYAKNVLDHMGVNYNGLEDFDVIRLGNAYDWENVLRKREGQPVFDVGTPIDFADVSRYGEAPRGRILDGQYDQLNTPAPPSATNLPPSVNQVLDLLQERITEVPINPNVEITPEMTASFLSQAQQELEPYYGQLFQQAQTDIQQGFGQIAEDVQAGERKLESQYGQQLQGLQENLAQRGLTFSTIRGTQEQNLAEQTQRAIESGRREAERRALELGTEGERKLGSVNLPKIQGIPETPTPILNRPGIFEFSQPATTRDLFTPVGKTSGTLEQERLKSEETRKRELIANERTLRGDYTI